MAIAVTHATTADSSFTPEGDTEWERAHSLTGFGTGVETALAVNVGSAGAFVTFNGALGTPSSGTLTNATGLPYTGLAAGTAGNLITWDAGGVIAAVATGTATHVLTSNGAGAAPTFQAAAGGGTTLNGITAATGAVTIASGNNTGIVWNWANTGATAFCHTFGETTAATGGDNNFAQGLLKIATLAASTQSPFQVFARGAFLFGINAAGNVAINETNSTYVNASRFAIKGGIRFTSSGEGDNGTANTGGILSARDGNWTVRKPGDVSFHIDMSESVFSPVLIVNRNGDVGIQSASADGSTNVPVSLFHIASSTADKAVITLGQHDAGATSAQFNYRKSRGSKFAPTIIPASDVLLKISGAGYTGATFTYQETARLEFKQGAGTPTDAANTGTGSIVTLYGKTQGTDATVIAALSVTGGSTATIKFHGSGMVAANNTVATVLGSVGPTGAQTTVQEWLKVDTPTGTRYIPCF